MEFDRPSEIYHGKKAASKIGQKDLVENGDMQIGSSEV